MPWLCVDQICGRSRGYPSLFVFRRWYSNNLQYDASFICRSFQRADDDKNRKLTWQEFYDGMKEYQTGLDEGKMTKEELKIVFIKFSDIQYRRMERSDIMSILQRDPNLKQFVDNVDFEEFMRMMRVRFYKLMTSISTICLDLHLMSMCIIYEWLGTLDHLATTPSRVHQLQFLHTTLNVCHMCVAGATNMCYMCVMCV